MFQGADGEIPLVEQFTGVGIKVRRISHSRAISTQKEINLDFLKKRNMDRGTNINWENVFKGVSEDILSGLATGSFP